MLSLSPRLLMSGHARVPGEGGGAAVKIAHTHGGSNVLKSYKPANAWCSFWPLATICPWLHVHGTEHSSLAPCTWAPGQVHSGTEGQHMRIDRREPSRLVSESSLREIICCSICGAAVGPVWSLGWPMPCPGYFMCKLRAHDCSCI